MSLHQALTTITSSIQQKLGNDIEVKDHPGRFTQSELNQIVLKRRAVRVALEQLETVRVEGDGIREANARFVAFVICGDARGEDRHAAALDIVEKLTGMVTYSQWDAPDVFRAVPPATISVSNLYSGEIDGGKGIAWWAISWVQGIRNH